MLQKCGAYLIIVMSRQLFAAKLLEFKKLIEFLQNGVILPDAF